MFSETFFLFFSEIPLKHKVDLFTWYLVINDYIHVYSENQKTVELKDDIESIFKCIFHVVTRQIILLVNY